MAEQIIERRRQALLESWLRDPAIMVQVESPDALPSLIALGPDGDIVEPGQVGQRRLANCAVMRGGADRDRSWSVWVAASYRDYRKAYANFLRIAYGDEGGAANLSGYDIDHLLNRARAPLDSTFIRIEAVPVLANQRWGALFERTASDLRFYANSHRQRRTMSWMIVAKLAAELPPLGPNDVEGIERLATFFGAKGFSTQEARTGLREMLEFAYGRS